MNWEFANEIRIVNHEQIMKQIETKFVNNHNSVDVFELNSLFGMNTAKVILEFKERSKKRIKQKLATKRLKDMKNIGKKNNKGKCCKNKAGISYKDIKKDIKKDIRKDTRKDIKKDIKKEILIKSESKKIKVEESPISKVLEDTHNSVENKSVYRELFNLKLSSRDINISGIGFL